MVSSFSVRSFDMARTNSGDGRLGLRRRRYVVERFGRAPRTPERAGTEQPEQRASLRQIHRTAQRLQHATIFQNRPRHRVHCRLGIPGVELCDGHHTLPPILFLALPPMLGQPLKRSLLLGHLHQSSDARSMMRTSGARLAVAQTTASGSGPRRGVTGNFPGECWGANRYRDELHPPLTHGGGRVHSEAKPRRHAVKANPPCQILDETTFLHLSISLGRYCSVSASLWPESGGGCNGGGMSARWSQSMSVSRCCCSVPPIGPLGTSRVEVFGRERRPKSRSGAS